MFATGQVDRLKRNICILVNLIPGNAQGQDQVTLSRGYQFDKDQAYTAQVVLNPGTGSEIRSDKIKIEFVNLYIEEKDPEFPNSKLNPFDYYPQLSSKRIVVKGVGENGVPFTLGSVRARVIVPSTVNLATITPQTEVPFNAQGEAVFNFSAPNITPVENEKVEIEFIYVKDGADQGSMRGEWRVRNNFNVKMKEVWAGEAVFVFDADTGVNHKGVTPPNVTDDGERYFDFVQELLNQVVPRKRSLADYVLAAENGIYDNLNTVNAIGLFKAGFNVDNMQNPKGDFKKLMKDYNIEYENIWRNLIVDKYILVGNNQNPAHNLINSSVTEGDTGLYELYQNVVQKFVNSMIRLCESYRDNSNPDNDIHGWVSRISSSGVTHVVTGNPQPVSYSYGGRRTIRQFNDEVSKHGAPRSLEINNNINQHGYYQQYNANLVDASMNEPNQMYRDHGILGQGTKRWPGLFKKSPQPDNFEEYESGTIGHDNPAHKEWFEWEKWTGIDCIGLTLQALRYAERPGDYAVNQSISDPVDLPVPGIRIADVCCRVDGTWGSLHHSDAEPAGTLYNTNVNNFFNQANRNLLYYWQPAQVIGAERLIHKGDFIKYGSTHITNVYSERWGLSQNNGDYDVIQALGWECSNTTLQCINYPWFRKVGISANNHPALSQPSGFGRIKLWE